MQGEEATARASCPVCDGGRLDREYEAYDDRYGFPGRFGVARCAGCGAGFLLDPVPEARLAELYGRYYPARSEGGPRRDALPATALAALVDRVNRTPELAFEVRGGRVLDVGCGYGASAGLVRLRGGSWVGLEADPRKVEAMRRAGLEAYATPLEEFAERRAGEFDHVLASQLIEHLAGPGRLLEPCRQLLKPKGRVALSTPNFGSRYRARHGARWINNHVPYHQVWYTRRALEIACARYGYSVLRLSELTPATWRIHQARYEAPPEGSAGRWYGRRIPLPAVAIGGAVARLGDRALGGGDCILAVVEKI